MEKTSYIVLLLCLFLGIITYMRAGTIPTKPFPSLHQTEIDRFIDLEIQKLSAQDDWFKISDFTRYDSTDYIDSHSIVKTSHRKIQDPDTVAQEIYEGVVRIRDLLNTLPRIRPYLLQFPVTARNIRLVSKYVPPSSQGSYSAPFIEAAVIRTHLKTSAPYTSYIEFFQNKPIFKEDGSVKCYRNSLFLEKSTPDLIRKQIFDITPSVPREKKIPVQAINYIDPKTVLIQCNIQRAFFPFFSKFCSEYGFTIASLSRSAGESGSYRPIAPGMWARKNITLAEAQRLAKGTFKSFYEWGTTNSFFTKYVNKDKETFTRLYPNTSWLCFRMTFWDEYLNRVEEPYIAQILCQDDKIQYFTADEGQRLVKVFEEPVPQINE